MPKANDPTRLMQGVIPYLALADARAAITFYETALGAELVGDVATMPGGSKVANASLAINGGVLMLSDAAPEDGQSPARGGQGITMQLVVDDGDA
jgi:uncharacterized glyoxalase superfamily protein PhnB